MKLRGFTEHRVSIPLREYLTIPLRFRIKWYLLPSKWATMPEYEVENE